MSIKRQKDKNKFPEYLMKDWENTDGVNFAIALARITGWLLHVDWWTPSEDAPVEDMRSVRVYVGTDGDAIYDFNGKKKIQAYIKYVIEPIAVKRATQNKGSVLTRFYSEADLRKLPLRVKANYANIKAAEDVIRRNKEFLDKIPPRINPEIPADIAGKYSFGWCVVFAEVIEELRGLPAVAMIADKYDPSVAINKPGYFHSVNLHPDGEVEDSWGKQPVEKILERFGV